ncbi:MAG: hypothetical protein IJK87_07090 [Prevotella sp.]|nr:hypothetical protein [Prevotella sp.]
MKKIVKDYTKPHIKVNTFISRHNLLAGWELGEGTTQDQFGHEDPPGAMDTFDPSMQGAKTNVWSDE